MFLGNAVNGLNAGVGQIDRDYVLTQTAYLIGAAVLIFATRYCWRYFLNGNARNLEIFLREGLFCKLQRLPASFYDSAQTGDLMALAINDIGAVRKTAGMVVANILTGVTSCLLYTSIPAAACKGTPSCRCRKTAAAKQNGKRFPDAAKPVGNRHIAKRHNRRARKRKCNQRSSRPKQDTVGNMFHTRDILSVMQTTQPNRKARLYLPFHLERNNFKRLDRQRK